MPKSGGYCLFDIETEPAEPAAVWDRSGIDPLPPIPREFDDSEVKIGHLKDRAKIDDKIKRSRAMFDQQEALAALEHPADLLAAVDRAALDPMTGRVCAFGLLAVDGHGEASVAIEDVHDGDERRLLRAFWGMFQVNVSAGMKMVGHNVFGFDLPFLVRRSWALDVDVPGGAYTITSGANRLSWHPLIYDTMRLYECGAYGKDSFVSLDRLGEFFGVGRKNGSGADFHLLLKSDRGAAHRYLANDLDLCHRVAQRMGIC